MAEYIDKQIILDKCQRLIDVERKQGSDVMNYGRERVNQTEVIMEYIEYMTPTTDVIERSEYELIHRQLAQAFDRIAELDKLNDELRSKIDKAIEEIENNRQLYEVSMDYTDGAKEQAYSEVLEILKRNIGE